MPNRGKAPGERGKLRFMRGNWHGDDFPEEGDILRTNAGSCYLVDQVVFADAGAKTHFTVHYTKLDDDAVSSGDPGVWDTGWVGRD